MITSMSDRLRDTNIMTSNFMSVQVTWANEKKRIQSTQTPKISGRLDPVPVPIDDGLGLFALRGQYI